MSAIGSVFLGDVQRQRVISTSTPPSSPPPQPGAGAAHSFSDVDLDDAAPPTQGPTQGGAEGADAALAPPTVSPALALELRLRWLETLVFGAKHDLGDRMAKGGARLEKLKEGETLSRRAEDLRRRLDQVAQSNDALKRFMDRCECAVLCPSPFVPSFMRPKDAGSCVSGAYIYLLSHDHVHIFATSPTEAYMRR